MFTAPTNRPANMQTAKNHQDIAIKGSIPKKSMKNGNIIPTRMPNPIIQMARSVKTLLVIRIIPFSP
jgi:hypothetical protein